MLIVLDGNKEFRPTETLLKSGGTLAAVIDSIQDYSSASDEYCELRGRC